MVQNHMRRSVLFIDYKGFFRLTHPILSSALVLLRIIGPQVFRQSPRSGAPRGEIRYCSPRALPYAKRSSRVLRAAPLFTHALIRVRIPPG